MFRVGRGGWGEGDWTGGGEAAGVAAFKGAAGGRTSRAGIGWRLSVVSGCVKLGVEVVQYGGREGGLWANSRPVYVVGHTSQRVWSVEGSGLKFMHEV